MEFLRQFSALVGEVYETALTRPDWARVAASTAATFNARIVGIRTSLSDDAEEIEEGIAFLHSEIPLEIEPGRRHFMVDDAWRRPRETVTAWQNHSQDEEFRRTEYYREVKLRNRLEHSAFVVTEPVGGLTNLIGITRQLSQEPFSQEHLDSLGVLAAHIHRAMRIGHHRTELVSANPLDRFQCAAFVVDLSGRIVVENEIGQSLLSADGRLSRDGRLRLGDELECQLTRLGNRQELLTPSFFNIERGDEDRTLAVMASAAPSALIGETNGGPKALVLISDPDRFVCPPTWSLKAEFGLTSAEARFVESFLRSKGIREAARHLGIGWETGRRHLKSVFEKTQTHSQVELTHLLLKHPASTLGELATLG